MRVLVAGCTGFVGSQLLPILRAQFPEARISGISRSVAAPSLRDRLDEHIALDLTDEAEVASAMKTLRPDVTIHLAAPRQGDLAHLLSVHVVGTANLLKAIRNSSPGSLTIVVGSAAEIGRCKPDELPLSESADCRPVDDYGIAKQAQSLLTLAAGLHQPVIRVRLFNIFGPGTPPSLLPGRCVQLLAQNAAGSGSVRLSFRGLSAVRDYTDVRDACEALVLAVKHGKPGRLYHVGTGCALSGTEVVQTLLEIAAPQTGLLTFEERATEPQLVPIQRCDATLADRELVWQPRIAPRQSLEDMWRQAMTNPRT